MTHQAEDELQLRDGEVYHRLSSVLTDTRDFETMSAELLQLGTEYLGVDNGHITRIEPIAAYWETIGSSGPSDSEFPVGLALDLEDTYCRKTIERGETIALHNAADQGWEEDRAYRKHNLETYVGTPYLLNNNSCGTVCFVSSDAHPRPFLESEVEFVEFLAAFISRILEQKRQDEIIQEKEGVITTLSRVLRHNFSNNLNVVHGHAEMMESKSDETLQNHIEAIKTNSQELIQLAEKAREMQSIVNTDFSWSPVELESLIQSSCSTVQESFPDAAFSVECPSEMTVNTLPYLEKAVTELVENAVKHTDESPRVEITVTRSQRTFEIRIADNGPGLPADEQEVLKEGEETPLAHGSGLGLWMVHWIVTRHNGTIDAAVNDTGTTIEVNIPYGSGKMPTEIDPSLRDS